MEITVLLNLLVIRRSEYWKWSTLKQTHHIHLEVYWSLFPVS